MANANDIIIHARNQANNGWVDVPVTVAANGTLKFGTTEAPYVSSSVVPAATNLATAGAGTITAAMIATTLTGGYLTRDCAGGNRTDTTDTAANIIAAIPALAVPGTEVGIIVVNISAGNYTSTLAGGTGVTLQGTQVIAQNGAVRMTFISTSATTLSVRGV